MLEILFEIILQVVATASQILYGVVLGVVQGVSEWLPVSSKTQIIIVSTYLLNLSFDQAYAFGLFMEIGTILAAIIYFRRELWSLVEFILGRGTQDSKFLFYYVLVSTFITGLIGIAIYLSVESSTATYNIAVPTIVIGLVLLGDAFIIKYSRSKYGQNTNRKKLTDMRLKDYIIVGIAQGIAALPGVSRSGATTSALLLLNIDADEAFKLSFIDGIFATSGAVLLTYLASRSSIAHTVSLIGASGLLISILVATVVSLMLINLLLRIAKKSSIIYLVSGLGIIALLSGIALAFNL